MIASLRIRILGPLVVEGVDTSALGSRKQRSLLRVLALGRGAPVGVDHLVDCLWPDEMPARPADQVGVLASRLRAALGADRLTRGDAGYALVADWIDLLALEQLTVEAERRLAQDQPAAAATAAAAGLALVGGPLLADEGDAPWADEARRSVDRTVARLRLAAADAALATGDPFGASVAAETALDAAPYDEHALRLLMTAHARAGRPAAALAAYARTRQTLAEELGASPSELTEALHLAVLRDEIAPLRPAPARPERGPTHLPGRSEAWLALDQALWRAEEGVQVVLVEGEAGIGKTRLLADWSAAIGTEHGVLWGSCDPAGAALPFQPLLDAFDRYLTRADPSAAEAVRTHAGAILGPLLAGATDPPIAADPLTAQAILFAGALQCCLHVVSAGVRVLIVDDIHLADATTLAWLGFVARRTSAGPLLIVLAGRPEHSLGAPEPRRLRLGPLDVDAVAEVVGSDRALALHARSGGNPLFLVELADFADDELPASILEAVAARVAQTGAAEATLRTAAVLGPEVDLDLLAGVLQQSAVTLLDHLEEGQRRQILEERGTAFGFRHALVREALVTGTSASRRALTHRDAARLLWARTDQDPLQAATHAREGGDLALAATALIAAAALTSSRFDHIEAERLLDESVRLHPLAAAYLARGRVRLTTENFVGAAADAQEARAMGAGVAAIELASWSAYYQRDFDQARRLCAQTQGLLAEGDDDLKRSVLALAGRVAHADGDLDTAQSDLEAAVATDGHRPPGVAGVWLGWLVADRGDPHRAADLAAESAGDASISVHPFGPAHQALLAAYAAALTGRIGEALVYLDAVDEEVERRHLHHFVGRTANYRAWLLRNLLFLSEADELNVAACETAMAHGLREPQAQATLDLADAFLRAGVLDEAANALHAAKSIGLGYAFSWRAQLRQHLLAGRLAMADGRPEEAAVTAQAIVEEATRLGLPRYVALARLLEVRAHAAMGTPADGTAVEHLLGQLERLGAPEAWWLTAEVARDYSVDGWWRVAERQVADLAAQAGSRGEAFSRQAGTVLERMRTSRRSG